MNTADIRNMDQRQWVFWASAIPVTIIVIGLSVFAIRYFEPVRQALGEYLYRRGDNELDVLETPVQRPIIYEETIPPSHPPPPYNSHMYRPNAHVRSPPVVINNATDISRRSHNRATAQQYYYVRR